MEKWSERQGTQTENFSYFQTNEATSFLQALNTGEANDDDKNKFLSFQELFSGLNANLNLRIGQPITLGENQRVLHIVGGELAQNASFNFGSSQLRVPANVLGDTANYSFETQQSSGLGFNFRGLTNQISGVFIKAAGEEIGVFQRNTDTGELKTRFNGSLDIVKNANPLTAQPDGFNLYADDTAGAGTAGAFIRNEDGTIINLTEVANGVSGFTLNRVPYANASGFLIDNADFTFNGTTFDLPILRFDQFGFIRQKSTNNIISTFGLSNNSVRLGTSNSGGSPNSVLIGKTITGGASSTTKIGIGNSIDVSGDRMIRIGSNGNSSAAVGSNILGYFSGGSVLNATDSNVFLNGQQANNRTWTLDDVSLFGDIDASLDYTNKAVFGFKGARPSVILEKLGNILVLGETVDAQNDAQVNALINSATHTYFGFNGTESTAGTTDGFQMYSKDIVAGNAAPHFKTELGNVIKLYQQSAITDATGGTEIATINSILAVLRNNGLIAT